MAVATECWCVGVGVRARVERGQQREGGVGGTWRVRW